MAGFCSNCGLQVHDGDRVCGNCGTPIAGASSAEKSTASVPAQRKNGNKIIILIGAAVCLIVLAVILSNVVGNFVGYKGTIRKMVKALQNYDMDTLESLASTINEELYRDMYEDTSKWYETRVSSTLDKYEDKVGTIKKIDIKMIDAMELSERRVEELKDTLVDIYNMDVSEIKKVMQVEMTLTVKGAKKSASYNVNELFLIKESGGWKLFYGSL